GTIGNAVADAVGVRVRDLPLTRERVARAIQDSWPHGWWTSGGSGRHEDRRTRALLDRGAPRSAGGRGQGGRGRGGGIGAGGGAELAARLRLMDRAEIEMQVLSACPQLPYGEDAAKAARAARFVNDQYAGLAE